MLRACSTLLRQVAVSNKPEALILSGSFVGGLTHLFADAALAVRSFRLYRGRSFS
jgi:hypothetical protein